MSRSLECLEALWQTLGDVPVNDDEELLAPFMGFRPGTSRETVWHWFEAQHPQFSVARMQGAK